MPPAPSDFGIPVSSHVGGADAEKPWPAPPPSCELLRAGSQEWKNVECEDCGLLLDDDVRPKPLHPPFQPMGDEVVVTCTP